MNIYSLRPALVFFVLTVLVLFTGVPPSRPLVAHSSEVNQPDKLAATSTYYTVRVDARRCAFPRCGGYFIKRVNQALTRCSNGRNSRECYVAEIDWNQQQEIDTDRALLRGETLPKTYFRYGTLDIFRVQEAWQAVSANIKAGGVMYRFRDRGIRCITHPCLTHHEAKLNSTFSRNIAGIDLNGAGATDAELQRAYTSMTGPDGVIATGTHSPVKGPAGRSLIFKVNQFYLPARPSSGSTPQPGDSKPGGSKSCFKTGCSNQICADEEMVSTCEWRPEYACYQKAKCERQKDGKCGFTQTPELTACLAGIKKQ
jgi:hypothetical protein